MNRLSYGVTKLFMELKRKQFSKHKENVKSKKKSLDKHCVSHRSKKCWHVSKKVHVHYEPYNKSSTWNAIYIVYIYKIILTREAKKRTWSWLSLPHSLPLLLLDVLMPQLTTLLLQVAKKIILNKTDLQNKSLFCH